MKIYQWFEYLPVKIRDKAQAYFFECQDVEYYEYEKEYLKDALWHGFAFKLTDEGWDYWYMIYSKYKNFKP